MVGKFVKTLYYVNKPVDQWYNMAFYKTVLANSDGTENDTELKFALNNVNEDSLEYISSEPGEIFRCYVSDDATINGSKIEFDLGIANDFNNWIDILFPKVDGQITSLMQNWKSLYDITFDKCLRTCWDCKYSNDPSTLANSADETEDEFSKRGNFDLFKISTSLNSTNFKNISGEIKLFANAELQSILSTDSIIRSITTPIIYNASDYSDDDSFVDNYEGGMPYYYLYVYNNFLDKTSYGRYTDIKDTDVIGSDVRTNIIGPDGVTPKMMNAAQIRERLISYYPRKILYRDSTDNYILKRRPIETLNPIYKSVELEVSNIMLLSTPNLYFGSSRGTYANSYRESLGAVKDYLSFFQNAQHRLPPVSYKNRILDSDYATFIYGSCSKYEPIQNYTTGDTSVETIEYNYNQVPGRISFVWGNSQVTRIETIGKDSSKYISKLYWNKSAFNEYTSEVGSVYNYTDSQHVTNVVTMEVGSITDRQCVLLPVVSSPLEYESRSAETGVIKAIDNIVATSALGYNTLGYPKNGILSYNTNGNVTIDSRLKNYIYIEQADDSNECVLGATIQKPVFTDVVHENIRSLAEQMIFLPNPSYSTTTNLINYDVGVSTTTDGNYDERRAAPSSTVALFYGDENAALLGINSLLSGISFKFDTPINNVSVYNYPDDNSIWTLTDDDDARNLRYASFIMNPYSITSVARGENNISFIDYHSVNVFYDESSLDSLSAAVSGATISTSLTTLKCFDYEGNLIDPANSEALKQMIPISGDNGVGETYYNLVDSYIGVVTKVKTEETLTGHFDMDYAPMFGVIWGSNEYISNNIKYDNDIKADIYSLSKNRTAVFDEYMGVNISAVKFKINEADLKSAPIFIEIKLLKYNSDVGKFYWYHDGTLDLDITTTYENQYDYDNPGDRFVEKIFENDGYNVTHHVYGIKFKICKIVPQNDTINSCKIANVQIFCSNVLNKYGTARSVEDVYIRRANANYADAYQIKCSEYVWRLPNTSAEWQSVLDTLKLDTSLEIKNSISTIEEYITNLKGGTKDNISAENYLGGDTYNFSRVNTYYISNLTNQNKEITEVLSDNYLVDSDIKISWKYVDYVYIYYSCYSFNAKELLDMYFGDKIYTAVREKLLKNINNLNLNSAFKDKYKFGGGIAVQKEFSLNTQTKSQVFNWKADIRYDQLDTYQDNYQTDWTKTDIYTRAVTKTDVYRSGHGYGDHCYCGSKYSYGKARVTQSTTTANVHYTGTSKIASKTTRNYLGSTLQNSKYSSVDNWTKSFSPRQIKYKIN